METKVHELKTLPEYFQQIIEGRKPFEIRKNDRDYRVGDKLVLKEWTPNTGFTKRKVSVRVNYMTHFEQKAGFVVMGISGLEHFVCWKSVMKDGYPTRGHGWYAGAITPNNRDDLDISDMNRWMSSFGFEKLWWNSPDGTPERGRFWDQNPHGHRARDVTNCVTHWGELPTVPALTNRDQLPDQSRYFSGAFTGIDLQIHRLLADPSLMEACGVDGAESREVVSKVLQTVLNPAPIREGWRMFRYEIPRLFDKIQIRRNGEDPMEGFFQVTKLEVVTQADRYIEAYPGLKKETFRDSKETRLGIETVSGYKTTVGLNDAWMK